MITRQKFNLLGLGIILVLIQPLAIGATGTGSFTSTPEQPIIVHESKENIPVIWDLQFYDFNLEHQYVSEMRLVSGLPSSANYVTLIYNLPISLNEDGSGEFTFDGDEYELPYFEENLAQVYLPSVGGFIDYHYEYTISFIDTTSNEIVNFHSREDYSKTTGYIFIETTLDPNELFAELKDATLNSEAKNRGTIQSLSSILENSFRQFNEGEIEKSIKSLHQYNNKLDRYIKGEKINLEDGLELVSQTNQLIETLQSI